jgi:hypothetical protein
MEYSQRRHLYHRRRRCNFTSGRFMVVNDATNASPSISVCLYEVERTRNVSSINGLVLSYCTFLWKTIHERTDQDFTLFLGNGNTINADCSSTTYPRNQCTPRKYLSIQYIIFTIVLRLAWECDWTVAAASESVTETEITKPIDDSDRRERTTDESMYSEQRIGLIYTATGRNRYEKRKKKKTIQQQSWGRSNWSWHDLWIHHVQDEYNQPRSYNLTRSNGLQRRIASTSVTYNSTNSSIAMSNSTNSSFELIASHTNNPNKGKLQIQSFCKHNYVQITSLQLLCDTPGAYYSGSNAYRHSDVCQSGDKAYIEMDCK